MTKNLTLLFISVFLLISTYGCVALLAGTAGGAGTAVWLSGKLSQEVKAPLDRSIVAAKSALKSLKLEVTKQTVKKNVAQVMSKYTDGKTIWIDIRRLTSSTSKIDVRVGAVNGDKEAADKILDRIKVYL